MELPPSPIHKPPLDVQAGHVDKSAITKQIKEIDERIATVTARVDSFKNLGLSNVEEAAQYGRQAIEDLTKQKNELQKQLNQ